MALIGFTIIALAGLFLVIAGVLMTYASTQIGDHSTAMPLLISAVGGAILYWACHNSPIVIAWAAP